MQMELVTYGILARPDHLHGKIEQRPIFIRHTTIASIE